MPSDAAQLAQLICTSANTVFFGGAGVSTDSGIPDFRGSGGLYRQPWSQPPEQVLSRSYLLAHPQSFCAFWHEKIALPNTGPNRAHLALTKLEALGKLKCIITQNIDGLHQMAGSRQVLELHGSGQRCVCMRCHTSYPPLAKTALTLPSCACGGLIRPDIVLYEEALDETVLQAAASAIAACGLLIAGGTSLRVYPAAGFVASFRGRLVIINQEPTPLDAQADLLLRGNIGQLLDDAAGIIAAGCK